METTMEKNDKMAEEKMANAKDSNAIAPRFRWPDRTILLLVDGAVTSQMRPVPKPLKQSNAQQSLFFSLPLALGVSAPGSSLYANRRDAFYSCWIRETGDWIRRLAILFVST